MKENRIVLRKGGIMVIPRGKNILICKKGIGWLTFPGSGDTIFRENDTLPLKTKGKICVTALEDLSFLLTEEAAVQEGRKSQRFFLRIFFSSPSSPCLRWSSILSMKRMPSR